MRAIYAYHTKGLHWSDIGYNFVIDRFGTIYEGRYGGIDQGRHGAQVDGFNTGSTGISVIGTFTDVAPPAGGRHGAGAPPGLEALVGDLDPAATAELTCGAADKYKKGATVTFPVIAGHRDANYTECPGDELYALLPAIRADVAERMGGGGGDGDRRDAHGEHRTLVSPNGDGRLDQSTSAVSVSAAGLASRGERRGRHRPWRRGAARGQAATSVGRRIRRHDGAGRRRTRPS